MKSVLRKEATILRQRGYSYGIIQERLGVSKSTLSNWLIEIPFRPNQETVDRIGRGKFKSALYRQRLKFEDIRKAKITAIRDVGKISKRDLFMLGIGLYLGEGSKSIEEVRVVNSNPLIIKLAMRWFKVFCGVRGKHLRICIHSYPDNNVNEVLRFWSRETNMPLTRFGKTIIDTRQNKSILKKRKLPYGTAHLYIRSGGTLKPGVKSLHRKIIGWIDAMTSQLI